jgi:PhzF family phenazine biosynthesis protein
VAKRNRYELWVMDVFTTELYRGNRAAVVFDASELTAATMQAIAREMNLSETAFVLPPTDSVAHYRVRFFTPRSELQFAGHPTIAVAAATQSKVGYGTSVESARSFKTSRSMPRETWHNHRLPAETLSEVATRNDIGRRRATHYI